jgi:hypothetical protein
MDFAFGFVDPDLLTYPEVNSSVAEADTSMRRSPDDYGGI